MIIYNDFFVPRRFGAITIYPFIFMKKKFKDDIGLRKHEEVHLKQFWPSFGMFWPMYLLSKKYRLKVEVEAYKEQIKWYDDDRSELFAEYLSTKYMLDITKEEALSLLKG
jgi:hypothetical protein